VAGSAKVNPLPLGSPKPMRVTLIVGLNFMLANLVVDLLYGVLDPRLRDA
jgi:peptide/nickel transport system permease protein